MNLNSLINNEKLKLKLNMRKLWTDNIIWTRMYIVDFLSNSPSINNTEERLLKNQNAIGNYLKSFFDETAANSLISLLKENIIKTTEIFKAIKEDNPNIETIEKDISINNEDIASFFSKINNYSKEELIEMFNTNSILIKYQFIARLNKDYNADIMYQDMGLAHILVMSDYLANCIYKE